MNTKMLLRFGKILAGAIGTLFLMWLAVTGKLGLSTYSFFLSGPARTIFVFGVLFFFPYLMMSSIIKYENEEPESLESGGLMKSYEAQNSSTKRFRKHMISIVFGVIVMLIIFAISNQTAPEL